MLEGLCKNMDITRMGIKHGALPSMQHTIPKVEHEAHVEFHLIFCVILYLGEDKENIAPEEKKPEDTKKGEHQLWYNPITSLTNDIILYFSCFSSYSKPSDKGTPYFFRIVTGISNEV